MKKCYQIKIFGRVQNVGFRRLSIEKARELGITGFIRNEPGGIVFLEAEGKEKALQDFLSWCRRGPAFARIERLDFSEIPERDFTDFRIDQV
ncbi:MAG: acylphosphatase [Minisyncoccia bacterium]|jgi:acylphosphatase